MTRPSNLLLLFVLLSAAPVLGTGCGGDASIAPDGGGSADAAPPDTAVPDANGTDSGPGVCSYGGATYPAGASFPSVDGCNTCTCMTTGGVACTAIACLPPDGGVTPDATAACDFSARYSYGPIGGNSVYVLRSELAPGNKYTHTRTSQRSTAPALSCSPALPTCGAQDVITAYDIEVHDLARPDVQAALAEAQPPLYGYDSRPVDGTVFEFKRADGRGFLLGSACGTMPGCRAIPAGVAQLAKRLQDLDTQQVAAPECQALRGP